MVWRSLPLPLKVRIRFLPFLRVAILFTGKAGGSLFGTRSVFGPESWDRKAVGTASPASAATSALRRPQLPGAGGRLRRVLLIL